MSSLTFLTGIGAPSAWQGKGSFPHHFKQAREDGLPEIHMDYCFMSTVGSVLATILVAKERMTKMLMATVVPMKGASIEFPSRRTLTFIKEIGLEGSDLVLKSDQEASITDVLNNVASRRAAASRLEKNDVEGRGLQPDPPRNIHEKSPVSSSAANGFIERGIQGIEGQARSAMPRIHTLLTNINIDDP